MADFTQKQNTLAPGSTSSAWQLINRSEYPFPFGLEGGTWLGSGLGMKLFKGSSPVEKGWKAQHMLGYTELETMCARNYLTLFYWLVFISRGGLRWTAEVSIGPPPWFLKCDPLTSSISTTQET